MISTESPLLVVFERSDRFDFNSMLENLSKRGVSTNFAKYDGLNLYEIIHKGMTLILSDQTLPDTKNIHSKSQTTEIFYSPTGNENGVIGISLGDHIKNGKQQTAVNRTLLEVGRMIGDVTGASSIIWTPAGLRVGFDYYQEAVEQYLSDGPFPVLIQIRLDEKSDGSVRTTGLSYFAEQEIFIRAAPEMSDVDLMKRVVRIAHDIATNGKIDTNIDTNGLEPDEHVSYRPSADLNILDVLVHKSPAID